MNVDRMSLMTVSLAALLSALLPGALPPAPAAAAPPKAAVPSDFNGDGYADLAIGVPSEDIGTKDGAGGVNVLYGSSGRPDRGWRPVLEPGQPRHPRHGRGRKPTTWIPGDAVSGEHFGAALASGDFDRDGYADLAVGVPLDKVGGKAAGAVNIIYGSQRGLTATGDQLWSRNNLPGEPGWLALFGGALAAADFSGDGYWDLAIGVPREDVDTVGGAGVVVIVPEVPMA